MVASTLFSFANTLYDWIMTYHPALFMLNYCCDSCNKRWLWCSTNFKTSSSMHEKHIIGSKWMFASFWYQTCKIWWKNNTVLTIWMETGTFWKVANVAIHQHKDLPVYHFLCTVEWLHFATLKTYLSSFRTLLSTDSFKFVSKWRHSPALHKNILICLIWSTFVKI